MNATIKLQELINKHSNDELSKNNGHVIQVWEDGEITSQQAGDLLWQRRLHQRKRPISNVFVIDVVWPHYKAGQAYCFCTEEAALEIREAIREAMIEVIRNVS